MHVSEEERLVRRCQRLAAWLERMEEAYGGVLSRPESRRALPGFRQPRWTVARCGWCEGRDCERCRQSRIDWASESGKHHLVDKNAGRIYVLDQDPYRHGAAGSGRTVYESEGTLRARRIAAYDAQIAALTRDERMRENLEGEEGPELRSIRMIESALGVEDPGRRVMLRKIQRALGILREEHPEAYRQLPRLFALILLQSYVPGRIR